MAHNLKKNQDGKEAMIYNDQQGKPWHALGTPVNGPMTAQVALSVFPFTYYKEPLHRPDGSKIETHDAIVISDTKKIMGIGGIDTVILQPTEVADFAFSLFEEFGVLCQTAGALGDGERIWMLLHTPDYKYEVFKGDEHKQYTLVTNSYDYSSALEARDTDIRVVCENTVNMAIHGSTASIKLRRTKNVKDRMALAASIFKGYAKASASFREAMKYLAKHPINDALVAEFENCMFGNPDKHEEGRSRTIMLTKREKFEQLLYTGKGTDIKGVVGSAYGLLNAYTEWSDWHSTTRGTLQSDGTKNRTNSILFGNASKEKTKALELVLALVK